MVQYARENKNVVAIFAKDSDHLAHFLGSAEYWRCDTGPGGFFDHNNFTTKRYNFEAIRRHLDVSIDQYHMMVAALAVVQKHKAVKVNERIKSGFHEINRNKGNRIYFDQLVSEVKQHCPADFNGDFKAIARFLFYGYFEETANQLEVHYNRFVFPNMDEARGQQADPERHFQYYSFYRLKIWNDEPTFCNFPFNEFDRDRLEGGSASLADLFITLVEKAMGILFYARKPEKITRKVVLKRSRQSPSEEIDVEVVYPECKRKGVFQY